MNPHTIASLRKNATVPPGLDLSVGHPAVLQASVPVELLLLLQLIVGHPQVVSPV